LGEGVLGFEDLLLYDVVLNCQLEYACLVLIDMGEEEGLALLKLLDLIFQLKNMLLVFDEIILVSDEMLVKEYFFIQERYFVVQWRAVLFQELFAVLDVLVGSQIDVVDAMVDVGVVVEAGAGLHLGREVMIMWGIILFCDFDKVSYFLF
jgi:hypothetical protein